jgi:peptidoglycan biosynthesis protein MviN/MurJ (putative lipid II flippase)
VLASLIMGAALWLVAGQLQAWFGASQGVLVRMTALGALVASGLAVYAAATLGLGAIELRQLRGLIRRSRSTPLA